MTIDTEKLEHEWIVWTETSEKSKLKEIIKLIKMVGFKDLLSLIQKKEYREFQLKIWIEWKKADGKLWQTTLERLQRFMAFNTTNAQLFRTLMLGKKTKSAIEWTRNSEKSKLKEIVSVLWKEAWDVEVDQLYLLIANGKYQKFQETIWMKKEECDWKLWPATLARLKKYMDKIIQTPWKVKLERSKDSTWKYSVYSYIIKKWGQPQHIRKECIRQLWCLADWIKITDAYWKEYPENTNFKANDRVFIKVPLVESLEKMSNDTKEKIKIQEDYINERTDWNITWAKITDSKWVEYPKDKIFSKETTVYINLTKWSDNIKKIAYRVKKWWRAKDILNNYITEYKNKRKTYKETLEKFNKQNPMWKDVELSFWIPVYHYEDIEKTLASITTKQKIDPKCYEVVFLLNRPSPEVDFDHKVKEKISRFKSKHPEYNIQIFEHTFNFRKNEDWKRVVNYWEIHKILADTIVYRNIQRKNIKWMDMKKIKNLIIKTWAADSTDKNPMYIANQLKKYSTSYWGKELVNLRWESRLPADICKAYPLIEILEFIQRKYDNRYAWWAINRDIGIWSYKSWIYCDAKWFRWVWREQWEDIALLRDIKESIKNRWDEVDMYYDSEFVWAVDESCDRWIWAMVENGQPYCDRYDDKTWNLSSKETNWNKYAIEHKWEAKFKSLELTKQNLEKNLSAYYRQKIDEIFRWRRYSEKYRGKIKDWKHVPWTWYLDNELKNATPKEKVEMIAERIVNPIMEKVFEENDLMWLSKWDYTFWEVTTEKYYDRTTKKFKYRVASAPITLKESAIKKINKIQKRKIANWYYNYR